MERGGPPARVDVVVDTGRLAAIPDYSPDDLTVTVQAGLTAGALAASLTRRRQWLPLDAPGAVTRTLGGLAATNASGPLRVRYGTMRDFLLGVRFVQADGVVTWGGARVVKSVSGYDVPKLMVGSLGTLGVLVELTLRLHPSPEAEATWLVTFESVEAAQALVARLLDSAIQPNRVEFMNGAALAAAGVGPGVAAIAVSIGTVEPAVRAQGDALAIMARETGGRVTPGGPGFWRAYDGIVQGGRVRLSVRTLPSALARTIGEIERATAGERAAARPLLAGRAALGVLTLGLDGVGAAAVASGVERLRAFLGPIGGGVTVERAPREVRAAVDPWGPVEPGALALMRKLKAEFDPTGVLNPGRFVGGL